MAESREGRTYWYLYPGDQVDIVISSAEKFPIKNHSFEVILCTQVLEHTAIFCSLNKEIGRVLKCGGLAIIAVPFIYNQPAAPDNYRRFSIYGIQELMEKI